MSTAMENLLSNRIQRSQLPLVVDTTVGSPAAIAGLRVGDRLLRVNGVVLRDIIEWNLLTDDEQVDLELLRGNDIVNVLVEKQPGES